MCWKYCRMVMTMKNAESEVLEVEPPIGQTCAQQIKQVTLRNDIGKHICWSSVSTDQRQNLSALILMS